VIKNLTPHAVVLIHGDGSRLEIPSSGAARAIQEDAIVGELEGIPLVRSTFGAPTGLPEWEEGVFLIVSAMTAKAAQAAGRRIDDLLLTSGAVRDAEGKIVGCTQLALYA
jgi:hypothetical protein